MSLVIWSNSGLDSLAFLDSVQQQMPGFKNMLDHAVPETCLIASNDKLAKNNLLCMSVFVCVTLSLWLNVSSKHFNTECLSDGGLLSMSSNGWKIVSK